MIPELAPGKLPQRVLEFIEKHDGWDGALRYVQVLEWQLDKIKDERDGYQNALYRIANGDQRPGHIDAITKSCMAEIARGALLIYGDGL